MNRNKFRGALVALACGDVLGANYEFIERHNMPPVDEEFLDSRRFTRGAWTDDTSQALCLATSLLEKGFDLKDQMDRYVQWYKTGYLSSVEGKCLDIGNQTIKVLDFYIQDKSTLGEITIHESYAGNGSVMRLIPVPLYYFPNLEKIKHYSSLSSTTTHSSNRCKQTCELMGEIAFNLLKGLPLEEAFTISSTFSEPEVQNLTNPSFYRNKSLDEIFSSGFVVTTLETSLYCLLKTMSLKDAIMMAASLGHDADTIAAVTGQLGGAYYGYDSIPDAWLRDIKSLPLLLEIADKLYDKEADNGEGEAEEDCKKQEVKPNSGGKLRRLSVPKLENTDADPEVHCKTRLAMQEKDRESVKKFAENNQLEISKFLTNSTVELCYTIQCNGEEIGYILKRWDEAGFRIGEDLVVPENRTAVFESNAEKILELCATNGITMGTDFVGDEIIIRIDGLTYNEGFNSKTFIAAINTLRECVEEIRGIFNQDIGHKPPVKPKSKSDREIIKKKDPSIVPVKRSEKLIAFRQEYQAIINSIAKKNKLKFIDSDPIDVLEFNYDIERNGEELGYFSRGWGDPGFRVAELLIIRGKSKIAVFNSNTKSILDFCKNNGIGMTTGWSVKNSKKELFVAIDAVIYNEGFNSKTFIRTLNAVRVCVEEIQGIINEVDARCGLPMEPKPERQTAPKERGEVILKVGACGGSLTILGERNAMGDWRFLIAKNEVALVDMLLPEDRVGMVAYERSDYLSSLEKALKRLDRYPWFRLHPVEVHPDFLDQVLLEVKKRGGESQVEKWRGHERWFEKNRKWRLKMEMERVKSANLG